MEMSCALCGGGACFSGKEEKRRRRKKKERNTHTTRRPRVVLIDFLGFVLMLYTCASVCACVLCVKTCFSLTHTHTAPTLCSPSRICSQCLAIVLWASAVWRIYMIIKWIREYPGPHGRQEKRIYSGDAYNAPRLSPRCRRRRRVLLRL